MKVLSTVLRVMDVTLASKAMAMEEVLVHCPLMADLEVQVVEVRGEREKH